MAQACVTARAAGTDVEPDEVRAFLDRLVVLRLVYEDGGRYLALALPANLPEAPGLTAA